MSLTRRTRGWSHWSPPSINISAAILPLLLNSVSHVWSEGGAGDIVPTAASRGGERGRVAAALVVPSNVRSSQHVCQPLVGVHSCVLPGRSLALGLDEVVTFHQVDGRLGGA